MDARTHKSIRRILLSNDDGIDAIGLKILYDIATQFSDDVWVIAPSENRSGASRSITLRRDVAVEKIGPKRYSCSGTPADCIIFGKNLTDLVMFASLLQFLFASVKSRFKPKKDDTQ